MIQQAMNYKDPIMNPVTNQDFMECNIQVLLLRLKCTYQGRIPHPFPGKFNGFYIGFQKGILKKTFGR